MTEEGKKLKVYYFQRRLIASQTYGVELVEKIKSAFSDNNYPGDDNLVASPEHRAECEECREIYELIVGKNWEKCLEDEYYGKLCDGQSFFEPLAWHYYLPAYLIQCIQRGEFSSLYFNPPKEADFEDNDINWNDWEQKRIDLLKSSQCKIIIDYLEITLKVWEGVAYSYESNLAPLKFWKENYQKALAKEQNLNK